MTGPRFEREGQAARLSAELGYPSTPDEVEQPFRVLAGDPDVARLVAEGRVVGWALVLAAEKWARGGGYSVLRLRSNVQRTEAGPFYERMGYEVIQSQWVFRKTL